MQAGLDSIRLADNSSLGSVQRLELIYAQSARLTMREPLCPSGGILSYLEEHHQLADFLVALFEDGPRWEPADWTANGALSLDESEIDEGETAESETEGDQEDAARGGKYYLCIPQSNLGHARRVSETRQSFAKT